MIKFLFYSHCIFGRFRYYWSPNSSLASRNCLRHPFYRTPVVSIVSTGQKSVHCCQQFCFLSFSFDVWSSSGLSAGPCKVCLVHYSTFWHHSQSFGQPSAVCRRHPTSKISTKQRTQTILHMNYNYAQMTKSCMCGSQLKLNEDKTEAILFSTLSLPSDCLPSPVTAGTVSYTHLTLPTRRTV